MFGGQSVDDRDLRQCADGGRHRGRGGALRAQLPPAAGGDQRTARARGSPTSTGRRYLDMLSAYSALNFGHRHPALVAGGARRSCDRVTLTSRAFHNDQLGPFCAGAGRAVRGTDAVLPMNSGAEAVETAIKVGPQVGLRASRACPADQAEIIVVRAATSTAARRRSSSFSDDPEARERLRAVHARLRDGPVRRPRRAARPRSPSDTVAFLVEPIQGEAGVVLPPEGFLPAARALCTERGVLFVADEIQSGLGRTGHDVRLRPRRGRAGRTHPRQGARRRHRCPLSAVVADWDVLGVIKPGEHGSTFGGNPLAVRCRHGPCSSCSRPGSCSSGPPCSVERVLDRLRGAALPGVRGGPRPRAVVGDRARARRSYRPAGQRGAARRAASSPRTPTPGRSGSRRRWSSSPPTSTPRWTRPSRCFPHNPLAPARWRRIFAVHEEGGGPVHE